jgi:hypothetical protein
MYGKDYGMQGEVRLRPRVNWVLLWLKIRNFQQHLVKVSHTKFLENLANGLGSVSLSQTEVTSTRDIIFFALSRMSKKSGYLK